MGSSVRRHNLVSVTPTVFKGFWWNFPVIVHMTWRWSYFIEVMLDWFFTRVIALWHFFSSKSCLCNYSCSFQWILVKLNSNCCNHLKRIILLPRSRLTAFYQNYGPLSVLAIYQQKFLSPQLLLHFSRDIDETFQLLFPWPEDDHILSRSCSTDFYQIYGPLAIFLTSLVSATPLAVFSGF